MQTVTLTGRLYNQEVTVAVPVYGPCPLCQNGYVYDSSDKSIGCTNWRGNTKGCQFTIWKEYAGFRLTEAHVLQLLQRGETDPIDGFTTRDGARRYASRLALADGKVKFLRE